MTREAAIKILKSGNNRECTWPEYCEAYNMAIQALEQKPKLAKPIVIDKIKDVCSCPHCGIYLFEEEYVYLHTDYKYCPYCGEKIIVGCKDDKENDNG